MAYICPQKNRSHPAIGIGHVVDLVAQVTIAHVGFDVPVQIIGDSTFGVLPLIKESVGLGMGELRTSRFYLSKSAQSVYSAKPISLIVSFASDSSRI